MKEWVDVDETELRKYLGLRIQMGFKSLPSYHMYWSADEILESPFYGKVMTRDRFDAIRSHFHFSDNDDPMAKNDKLWKIRPVLECLCDRFRTVYKPNQQVCVDESLFRYRGRHQSIQYIPSKRSRYGLKAYKLCETAGVCTGYTSAMKIYMGDDGKNASFGVVFHLMKEAQLFDKGYIVYTDNWYSSPTLFHHLQSRKTSAIGTVRTNRKFMPRLEVKKKGEISYMASLTGMLALAWMDKKQVTMLSTLHSDGKTGTVETRTRGGQTKTKTKPLVVLDYNKGKAGVDVSDQMAVSYPIRRRCVKWYQTLFCHLIDTTVVNAYLVHQALGGQLNHFLFRKELARSLCGREQYGPRRPPGRRPPSPDDPVAPRHRLVRTDRYRRCKVCSQQGLRKVNKFECRLCDGGFCPGDCYNAWPAHQGEP